MIEEKSVSHAKLKTSIAVRITEAIDAVLAVGLRVVVTLETLFGPVLNTIGALATLTFSIPGLGLLFFLIATAFHRSVAALILFPEVVLCLCGILPEKRLRLRIMIPSDEQGQPICQVAEVLKQLQWTIDLFQRRANVRILPIGPFVFPSKHAQKVDDRYIWVDYGKSSGQHLDCHSSRLRLRGRTWFSAKVCSFCYWACWRRMIGYGTPIGVFAVRSIDTTFTEPGRQCVGLTMIGIGDFVLIDFRHCISVTKRSSRLAHELGHACRLPHSSSRDNLMYPLSLADGSMPALTAEQVFRIRVSPHVSYF